jgi:hypothetical protein
VIIVDGYNLIGDAAGTLSGLALEKERTGLIREAEKLAQVTGEKIMMVFDGPASPKTATGAAEVERKSPVTVTFSKAGQTADSWILKYLSRRPKGSAILITRDGELASKARKLGFKTEPNLDRLEAKAQPYLAPAVMDAPSGGDLLASISRQSRENLANLHKKLKKS